MPHWVATVVWLRIPVLTSNKNSWQVYFLHLFAYIMLIYKCQPFFLKSQKAHFGSVCCEIGVWYCDISFSHLAIAAGRCGLRLVSQWQVEYTSFGLGELCDFGKTSTHFRKDWIFFYFKKTDFFWDSRHWAALLLQRSTQRVHLKPCCRVEKSLTDFCNERGWCFVFPACSVKVRPVTQSWAPWEWYAPVTCSQSNHPPRACAWLRSLHYNPQLSNHFSFLKRDKEENMNIWKPNAMCTLWLFSLKTQWTLNTSSVLGCRPSVATQLAQRGTVWAYMYVVRINAWLSFLFCNSLARHHGLVQRAVDLESQATSCLGGLLTQGNLSIVGLGFPDSIFSARTKIICHFSKLWWVPPNPLEILSWFSFLPLAPSSPLYNHKSSMHPTSAGYERKAIWWK